MNITRGSAADIPALGPLWVEVHRAHVASMPELAPYVTDEETLRLYRRRGFRPTWLYMSRFAGRAR